MTNFLTYAEKLVLPIVGAAIAFQSYQLSERIADYERVLASQQQAFDQLNQPRQQAGYETGSAGSVEFDDASGEAPVAEERLNRVGKVSGLKLDVELQDKSEAVEREYDEEQVSDGGLGLPVKKSSQQVLKKKIDAIALPLTSNIGFPQAEGAVQYKAPENCLVMNWSKPSRTR